MDESWRMKMGIHKQLPNYPHRRSTEDAAAHRRKPVSDDHLSAEDFTDVFGGPPRTVLSRQFSVGSSSTTGFMYEEIFRQPEKVVEVVRRNGRNLPEFRIPTRGVDDRRKREKDRFYNDVFGCWEEKVAVRSRSRSKASSSSVLSSEELSPLRPVVRGGGSGGDDDDVSSFASKLRPINVRKRWNSTKMAQKDANEQQNMHGFEFAGNKSFRDTENDWTKGLKNYPLGSSRVNTSPETISMEPMSNNSFRVSADDLELNSPSSSVSSICQSEIEPKLSNEMVDEIMTEKNMEEEEDDVMSSYVIEINGLDKEEMYQSSSNGVDEAIAWAKEKFQTYCSESKSKWDSPDSEQEVKTKKDMLNVDQLSEGHSHGYGSPDEQPDKWTAEEDSHQFNRKVQNEMQVLDEKIRLWSNGKGADIRLLLSSLHHILWPNSGWLAIPLMNIMENSQVKKAYQKARLCLHPDKLQQRGATLPQRYIAEKAFSILQVCRKFILESTKLSHERMLGLHLSHKIAENLLAISKAIPCNLKPLFTIRNCTIRSCELHPAFVSSKLHQYAVMLPVNECKP